MHRYVAFICGSSAENSIRSMRWLETNLNRAASDWSWLLQQPDMLIAQTGISHSTNAYSLSDNSGIVIGTLFRHNTLNGLPHPAIAFDHEETQKIVRTGCKHLVDQYWGKYVAFVRDSNQNTSHVLRDPTAQMRCYRASWNGIEIFFSHIEDCVRFVPLSLSINWRYVITSLLMGKHAMRECGLSGVEDTPGGERLSILKGSASRTILWNPANFFHENAIEDQVAAASLLRNTVQNTINALASRHSNIALSLSGGLDSSIIAGCLAQAPSRPNVSCFNYYLTLGFRDEKIHIPTLSKENLAKYRRIAGSGHGDEREFARLVCERWGYPLVVHERHIQDIDMSRIADAPISITPSSFIGFMDLDDAETRMAQACNSDAFFSGEGGDTLFYATFQSVGAIDYVYKHGLGTRLTKEILNACALSRESAWRVLGKSMKFGLLRRNMPEVYDMLKCPHLLTDHSARSVSYEDTDHPWSQLVDRLPPGKRNQIIGLARSCLFYHYEFRREQYAAAVNPFTAQPVVEACLRIPTYILLTGGMSRGLARLAFADLLPPEILQRTVKGTGAPFFQRLTRANMSFIRQMLLGGELVREGILDEKKLENYLVDGQQFSTVISGQILHYAATEAWVRQWATMFNRAAA